MSSFIYVVASTLRGPCKIGFSKQPEVRLKQLQTGHAETLRLFHKEPIDAAQVKLMEGVVHRENSHRKLQGEWFNMTVEEAIGEVRHSMIRFEEEVARRATWRNR